MSAEQSARDEVSRALVAAVHTLPAALATPLGEILRTLAGADRLITAGPADPPNDPAIAVQYAAHVARELLSGVLTDYRDTLARLDAAALQRVVRTLMPEGQPR